MFSQKLLGLMQMYSLPVVIPKPEANPYLLLKDMFLKYFTASHLG